MYITNEFMLTLTATQDDIEEDEQVALQDEESLIDGTLPQHVKHDTFPRPSLLNSNLPDRKNVSRINRSEMYSSLLKRSTSQDIITLGKAETTQHTLIHKLPHCDDQSLPKDTDNTTGLATICNTLFHTHTYYSTTQYKPMANEIGL